MVLKDQKVLQKDPDLNLISLMLIGLTLIKIAQNKFFFFQFLKKLHKNQKFTTHNIFRHVPNMGIKRDDDGGR